MDRELKEEIKEAISETLAPFLVKMDASNDSHRTEIERLTKQSGEHYENFRTLEDKMQKQVQHCQSTSADSFEKSGSRLGDLEQTVARMDEHVSQNAKDIKEIKDSKRFNVTQAITVVGLVAVVTLSIIQLVKGG